MNVMTIITIIITGICLFYSIGVFVFYLIKKAMVKKQIAKDLVEDAEQFKKDK